MTSSIVLRRWCATSMQWIAPISMTWQETHSPGGTVAIHRRAYALAGLRWPGAEEIKRRHGTSEPLRTVTASQGTISSGEGL